GWEDVSLRKKATCKGCLFAEGRGQKAKKALAEAMKGAARFLYKTGDRVLVSLSAAPLQIPLTIFSL
ncbi:hypothetical protein, partial [Deinococcus misasensis]|uniref:hypothetical protein n=1 Tax=Deinococcus misasensis TaxID=392413 RepID=UPI00054D2232